MQTFTIDSENNITFHASLKQTEGSAEGTETFSSPKELGKLAAHWPGPRLVEIWNSLAYYVVPLHPIRIVQRCQIAGQPTQLDRQDPGPRLKTGVRRPRHRREQPLRSRILWDGKSTSP